MSNGSVLDSSEDVAEGFNRDGFLIASGLYGPEEMLEMDPYRTIRPFGNIRWLSRGRV